MIRRVTPKHTQAPTAKRLAAFALVLMLLLLVLPLCVNATNYLPTQTLKFDETDVWDDLESSTMDGAKFDFSKYPAKTNGAIELLSFTEYCYALDPAKQANYAIYLYVYNPAQLMVDATSQGNFVQMANKYDTAGKPTAYTKYPVELLSASGKKDYPMVFLKFKVKDCSGILSRVNTNPDSRKYDVSGIELHIKGRQNATDYNIGGSYTFSGYVEGYGENETGKSTLECASGTLETIQPKVQHTNYRTGTSKIGKDHQYDINTVYFSVPNSIMEKYGDILYSIHAQWYEYKTKEIVVTRMKEFYDETKKYIGVQALTQPPMSAGKIDGLNYYLLYEPLKTPGLTDINYGATWAYNAHGAQFFGGTVKERAKSLEYLFYVDDINDYDPYNSNKKTVGGVRGNDLYNYMRDYAIKEGDAIIQTPTDTFNANLFENTVDAGRKGGINDATLNIRDNTFDLTSYDGGGHTWWDKVIDYGFFGSFFSQTNWASVTDVSPIEEITSDKLSGYSNDEISKKLLINKNDVDTFKAYCERKAIEGERVFAFRFAVTDYFSGAVEISQYGGVIQGLKGHAYMAQQTVFFDFDMIDITFKNGESYTTIPVVMSPMDIVNDITPPLFGADGMLENLFDDGIPWWVWMIIIGLVLLLIVILLLMFAPSILVGLVKGLAKALKYIALALWYILTLPFRLIKKLIDKLRGGSE